MLLFLNQLQFLQLAFAILFVLFVGGACYFLGRREATQTPALTALQQTGVDLGPTSVTPTVPTPTGGFKWRKIVPHLAFVAAIIVFILLRPALHSLLTAGAPVVAADGVNASSELVVADQVAGGYVQAGSLISRIIISILFYALFSFLPWAFQQVTHPAFAAWKKERYKIEFELMTAAEKFDYDKGMSQSVALRVIATAIFCLVA